MPPAGYEHGAIGIRFAAILFNFVSTRDLGCVTGSDTGFILCHDPDTVRAPDVSFVSRNRLPETLPVKYWDGAPDLAIEVLSRSDSATEMDAKVQEYLDAGATEVIVITPKMKMVKIFRQGQTATILRSGDTLRDLVAIPGFECSVNEIFA
jgi:Uma2 family endonuclease